MDLNKRTLNIPATQLIAGVTYKLEVSFSDGTSTYAGSRFVTPLLNLETISFESQSLPVNQIQLSSSSAGAGETFNLTYTLSEVRAFQDSKWWFILHGEGIQTYVSEFSNDIFTV